ncbi:MAG: ATP-dependent Clp protease proteolytic subunit [Cocleimonas sp.]|nr:ATP-dependent Clp protease proteolytic subunit [Cocleimonas sp.]
MDKNANMFSLEEKKGLGSEHHTLFIEDIPEERQTIKDAPPHYFYIAPSHRLFRVFISSFSENKKGLHAIFNELRKANAYDRLELRINSDGGLVTEGQQFFNIILEIFDTNTTTVLDNHGYSMGALLFCMGQRRIIYPYSEIMFHNYTHGAWGKGENVKSHVKHTARSLTSFFKDVTVSQGFLTKKEFKEMLLGKDFWMGSKEMCKRGIATHVVVWGETITAKKYLKGLKKGKKAKKKASKQSENKSNKNAKKSKKKSANKTD